MTEEEIQELDRIIYGNKEENGNKFIKKHKDLINKFLEIAERKVSIIDDYGDENWDVLPKEIGICMTKLHKQYGMKIHFCDGEVDWTWLREKLNDIFQKYHKTQKSKHSSTVDIENLTGVEFETYIVKILKENGYNDVRQTQTSGDQGADLIVKKDGKTIIIQAKRHKGSVGNKAVQEVIAALSFYKGDEGWVVTNSTFTPSAKSLAHKSNIKLIDGRILSNFKDFLNQRK